MKEENSYYISHGSYNERNHIRIAKIKFQKKITKIIFPIFAILGLLFVGFTAAFIVGIFGLCYYGFLCLQQKLSETAYSMKRQEDRRWN